MRRSLALAALILPQFVFTHINAANFDDPTWPCVQRKVPNLSIGQMWSGPIVDKSSEEMVNDDAITALASALAVRRTSLEEAEKLVQEFAKASGENREDHLAHVFALVFERIDSERAQIISGIARYAGKQTGLAERIDAKQEELAALEAKEEKTNDEWDRQEELMDTLEWDTRLFDARKESLTYVCETPVILEKRAFALSRMIAGAIEE